MTLLLRLLVPACVRSHLIPTTHRVVLGKIIILLQLKVSLV